MQRTERIALQKSSNTTSIQLPDPQMQAEGCPSKRNNGCRGLTNNHNNKNTDPLWKHTSYFLRVGLLLRILGLEFVFCDEDKL
jgi:hypothetical protein